MSEDNQPTASNTPKHPVFYDAGQRRWPILSRILGIIGMTLSLAFLLFLVSLFALPLLPYTSLPHIAPIRDVGNLNPIATEHAGIKQHELDVKLTRDIHAINRFRKTLHTRHVARKMRASQFTRQRVLAELHSPPIHPIVAGFYVDWEHTSLVSAEKHINALTDILPEWLHLKPSGSPYSDPSYRPFVDARERQDNRLSLLAHSHSVAILPLLNNYTSKPGQESGDGNWDTNAVDEILNDPAASANLIIQLRSWVIQNHMQGVNIDFEEVDVDDKEALVQFMKHLYEAFHPSGLLVTQDIQLDNAAFDIPALSNWCDWIVPMFYDQHAGGSDPGPVGGIDWTRDDLTQILKQVPPDKIVMGVGNQAYNWVDVPGRTDAVSLSYQNAVETARESQPDAVIQLDKQSLNPTFHYWEDDIDSQGKTFSQEHVVWMLDAVSVYNQLILGRARHIRGAALWVIGEEDPSIWNYLDRSLWASDWSKIIADGKLNSIVFSTTGLIDFDGEGGLLQPKAIPQNGARTVVLNHATRLITAEFYKRDASGNLMLPTPYVVRRYGGTSNNSHKQLVLTFDDGPDPDWTPQILSILRRYNVPAVFFVCGKQAESFPWILRQEWNQGDLIGNHTWDHPELDALSTENQRVEITSTQRVIQAITGHSTTLFRPPYGGDVEPTTGSEVRPLILAGSMNYITVGETNDPQDWRLNSLKPGTETIDPNRTRTVAEIVNSVVDNRDEGSIVLLHDAGGDRSRTVAALPQIITKLRSLGYTFISLPELAGIPKTRLMPVMRGRDTVLAGADHYLFLGAYFIQRLLTTLFLLSIVLGVSRVLLMAGPALIQWNRERKRIFPSGFSPPVSVVIAAYNEEMVIVTTIQTLLQSDYSNLVELLVVDDGSQDHTSQLVESEFGSNPKVRLLKKSNGGKSSALNMGISEAQGEIIVSLDADTLFAPDTISRMVRHFHDPAVGAVSGNVRVGNLNNILTKWQSLEYTTSQNFDRRAYDMFNCITVVPGAAGSFRKEAVVNAGGYLPDTLAEDTDLTWRLRRSGQRIVNDSTALAYTEAPETLRDLARQRFRWAFGTLQCLWKHRDALFGYGSFGWLALPGLWVYQILFPMVSPFMDIGILFSLWAHNFVAFGTLFALMFGIEFLAAWVAIQLDGSSKRLLPYLLLQRFVYRQLMYYVMLKSLGAALRGGAVGWNKLERSGAARIDEKPASLPKLS